MATVTRVVEMPCIYVCGAEGTGKTTVVGSIARRYGLTALPETAQIERDIRGLSFGLLDVATVNAYQRAVFKRQIELEAASAPPYVADGHCLENLAYASEYARCFLPLEHSLHHVGQRPGTAVDRLKSGIVFFLRPHESMMEQGERRIGASYAAKQRIDAKLEMLMQLWGVPFVSIESPNPAKREELIDYILTAKGFICQSP